MPAQLTAIACARCDSGFERDKQARESHMCGMKPPRRHALGEFMGDRRFRREHLQHYFTTLARLLCIAYKA